MRPEALPARLLLPFVAALAIATGTSTPLDGRQIQRESQVPLAPELGIVELSADLRARLDLFPGIPGFAVARLFLGEDGRTVLELESVQQGRIERERRLLTEGELAELRQTLSVRLAAVDLPSVFDREGRGGLVLGQTLLGVAYHGWAVPVALDIDSAQGVVAAYLLTAGASFYLSYRLTRDRSVTEAHRDLSMYGGTRGILYGMLLADAVADPDGRDVDRIRFGAGVVGSAASTTLGFLAADRYRPDEGRAALWGLMGDFGLAAGAGLAYVTGPYTSREVARPPGDFGSDTRLRSRPLGHALTMAGGVGGLAAGRWLGERESYTEGNVHVLRSAGILGAQTGLTLTRAIGTEDGQALAGGALAGGIAGLVGGNHLLRERRFSGGEGLLVNAGHLAGGATALGLTYLAVEEIDEHPLLYLATSTLGSVLGAGLVYRALGFGSGGR